MAWTEALKVVQAADSQKKKLGPSKRFAYGRAGWLGGGAKTAGGGTAGGAAAAAWF